MLRRIFSFHPKCDVSAVAASHNEAEKLPNAEAAVFEDDDSEAKGLALRGATTSTKPATTTSEVEVPVEGSFFNSEDTMHGMDGCDSPTFSELEQGSLLEDLSSTSARSTENITVKKHEWRFSFIEWLVFATLGVVAAALAQYSFYATSAVITGSCLLALSNRLIIVVMRMWRRKGKVETSSAKSDTSGHIEEISDSPSTIALSDREEPKTWLPSTSGEPDELLTSERDLTRFIQKQLKSVTKSLKEQEHISLVDWVRNQRRLLVVQKALFQSIWNAAFLSGMQATRELIGGVPTPANVAMNTKRAAPRRIPVRRPSLCERPRRTIPFFRLKSRSLNAELNSDVDGASPLSGFPPKERSNTEGDVVLTGHDSAENDAPQPIVTTSSSDWYKGRNH